MKASLVSSRILLSRTVHKLGPHYAKNTLSALKLYKYTHNPDRLLDEEE